MENINPIKVFEHGATWLRADFHLHTKADAEFIYNGDPNFFANNYIQQLVDQQINIGVITNHNKFDLAEFKELRKNALKKETYLLPGLEFSVKDGAKGLHVLLVFDDTWIYNSDNHNFIQDFIVSASLGIAAFDAPPYKNSNFTFEEACNHLDKFGSDYFIIMPHVDESSGVFYELESRGLENFLTSKHFQNKVLAFQKVRTRDNHKKAIAIIGNKVPVAVEGTDCANKGIEGIGLGNEVDGITQKTFMKLGAFNFEALEYALKNPLLGGENRVASSKPEHSRSYLKSVTFKSKRLGESTLNFSASMNNLIGIRGSGKSSILETVRYGLDIPLSKNSKDRDYKERIINELLGSGGKMTLELIDSHGRTFIAEKIYGETTNIFHDGKLQRNLKVNALISNPLYFGQKDLSELGGETSTEDLISRLVRDKIKAIQVQINDKANRVITIIQDLQKLNKSLDQKPELEAKKAEIEVKLKVFKDHEVDKKLNRQIEFNKDSNRIDLLIGLEESLTVLLNELWLENKNTFKGQTDYTSKENADLFSEAYQSFANFHVAFNKLETIIKELNAESGNIRKVKEKFLVRYEALKEEFSQIKREINIPNLDADSYVRFSKDLDLNKAKLAEVEKLADKKNILNKELDNVLVDLKNLWHKEYEIVKNEIDKINAGQTAIQITVDFKGNKDRLKDFIKDTVRGSGLTDKAITSIATGYKDLIEVHYDFAKEDSPLKQILSGGDNFYKFQQKFKENITGYLTYRVPDKYTIYYKGDPLDQHSLGQRASAIILFILTLKENDLIIIDQPEDDLDNQTIYADVITELKMLKNKTQFIFATHNANIPVLGDCEQIFACEFLKSAGKDEIKTAVGSIDDPDIQKKVVNIMEGGQDAFNQRKLIYELWKQ